jgi:putative aldouronate transport system substrate-binding protein
MKYCNRHTKYSHSRSSHRNSVPVTAKHPEAAIKFLNWFYSSKENHNLFLYGAEGTHYTSEGDRKANFVKDKDNQAYYFPHWMIGNIKYVLFDKDVPDAYLKVQTEPPAMKVDMSTVTGFHLNSEPIAVEYAIVLSEIKAKIMPIKMGGCAALRQVFPGSSRKLESGRP